jgi:hypothetical protein
MVAFRVYHYRKKPSILGNNEPHCGTTVLYLTDVKFRGQRGYAFGEGN